MGRWRVAAYCALFYFLGLWTASLNTLTGAPVPTPARKERPAHVLREHVSKIPEHIQKQVAEIKRKEAQANRKHLIGIIRGSDDYVRYRDVFLKTA